MATGLENLWIYNLAEDLEIEVHEVTKKIPRDELFRSVDQIRRSSAAAPNLIAEGSHKTTVKEKNRFLDLAKGEAEETKRNILKSARKKFITNEIANNFSEKYTVLLKGITAYSKFLTVVNK